MLLDKEVHRIYRSIPREYEGEMMLLFLDSYNTRDSVGMGNLKFLPDNYILGECLLELD